MKYLYIVLITITAFTAQAVPRSLPVGASAANCEVDASNCSGGSFTGFLLVVIGVFAVGGVLHFIDVIRGKDD